MHLFHIRQCTNHNKYISFTIGALQDMEQVHCGISELGQFSTNDHMMGRDMSDSCYCNYYVGTQLFGLVTSSHFWYLKCIALTGNEW